MTTQSTSSVETLATTAIHATEGYYAAGKTLAGAYRTGVQRLLNRSCERYSSFMAQPKPTPPRYPRGPDGRRTLTF